MGKLEELEGTVIVLIAIQKNQNWKLETGLWRTRPPCPEALCNSHQKRTIGTKLSVLF